MGRVEPVRVLVVDDDPCARAGVAAALADRPEVSVVAVSDWAGIERQLAEDAVAVVVADVDMSDTDVLALVAVVRSLTDDAARWSNTMKPPLSVVCGSGLGRQDLSAETAVARLSVREREILRAIAAGLRNVDIAESMYLSVPTVKEHVSAILHKLGADNRVQAAVIAHRAHLRSF